MQSSDERPAERLFPLASRTNTRARPATVAIGDRIEVHLHDGVVQVFDGGVDSLAVGPDGRLVLGHPGEDDLLWLGFAHERQRASARRMLLPLALVVVLAVLPLPLPINVLGILAAAALGLAQADQRKVELEDPDRARLLRAAARLGFGEVDAQHADGWRPARPPEAGLRAFDEAVATFAMWGLTGALAIGIGGFLAFGEPANPRGGVVGTLSLLTAGSLLIVLVRMAGIAPERRTTVVGVTLVFAAIAVLMLAGG